MSTATHHTTLDDADARSRALRGKVLRNARIVSIALGATMLLSLITRMFMPRILGVETLGVYYFAESYAFLFLVFMSPGIESYVMRNVPGDPTKASEVVFTASVFQGIAAIVLLGLMALSLHLTGYPPDTVALAVVLGGFAAITIYQTAVVRAVFLSLDRYRLISTVEVVTKAVQVAAVVAALTLSGDPLIVAVCFLGAELFELAVLFPYAVKAGIIKPRFRPDVLKTILKVGLPFFLLGICSQINASIDTTILEKLSNPIEVGYYGAAVRLKGILLLMIPVIGNALMPLLSKTLKEDRAAFATLSRDSIRTVLGLAFLPTLALVVLADHVTVFLYGAAFAPSARVLTVIGPLAALTYLNCLLMSMLTLSTDGKKLTMISAGCLVLNVGLNVTLVPIMQKVMPVAGAATGAAIATFIAESAVAAALFVFSPDKLIDRRIAVLLIALVMPLAAAILFFDQVAALPFAARVVMLAVFGPLYALVTGMITKTELKGFAALIRRRIGRNDRTRAVATAQGAIV